MNIWTIFADLVDIDDVDKIKFVSLKQYFMQALHTYHVVTPTPATTTALEDQ